MSKDLEGALTSAIIANQREVVSRLLAQGVNPNARLGYERTPLFYAVTTNVELTKLLLAYGANVNARASDGSDALSTHLNEQQPGSLAVVTCLLDAGATPRPEHTLAALKAGDAAVLEAVLAAGAPADAMDPEGGALWRALCSTSVRSQLALLVKYGLDPNTRLKNAAADTTVLMEVCSVGDLETAQRLLALGADVNARGRGTPLSRAEESGNRVLVDLLLEHGATPLRGGLDAAALQQLDEAEHAVRAEPSSAHRLAWARALIKHGFRAAAAHEVEALARLGSPAPDDLVQALGFESPAGTGWTFEPFTPATEGVSPRVDDTRFPGARVRNGARVLPLLLTLEPPCTECDDAGEQTCSLCNGAGSYSSFLDPDHDVTCSPRQRCVRCRGLKFVSVGRVLGQGPCAHPAVVKELDLAVWQFVRCTSCGLAAFDGELPQSSWNTGRTYACGLCGHFACRCG